MIKKYFFISFFVLFLCSSPTYGFHPDRYASVVIDGKTGHILHAEKANKLRYPASLTKMMTLYIVFQKLDEGKVKVSDWVTVSARSAKQPPTRMGLHKGDKVSIRDLIYGIVVHSANDGACAIAEHVAGNEENFVRLMNQEAQKLGMKSTHFQNPHGLPDPSQLTTARDMAVLGKALYDHFAHHAHYFATETFIFKGKPHRNHNKLLGKYGGMNGIKTGYTNRSGFNLVASAVRGYKHIIAVVLGGKNAAWRDKRMKTLVDHGFTRIQYEGKPRVYLASSTISHMPTVQDTPPLVNSVFKEAETNGKVAPFVKPCTTVKVVRGGHPSDLPAKESLPRNPSSQWTIRVGSYKGKGAAQKALQTFPRLIKTQQVQLIPHKSRGKTVYQVMLQGLNKNQALKACSTLKKKGLPCVAFTPQKKQKKKKRASI